MKKKLILSALIIFMLMLLCTTQNVQAWFQANGGSATKNTLTEWAYQIRYMELTNCVMGLNERVDITTLKATTAPNNIDVHLLKNTEYGAIAILSASPQYGKQGTGADSYIHQNTSTGIATTTGNKYGIYGMGTDWEWVAGGATTVGGSYHDNYYNRYSSVTSKPGDATIETQKWKGSNCNYFYPMSCLKRGFSGAFSYDDYAYGSENYAFYARAGVVCGQGF